MQRFSASFHVGDHAFVLRQVQLQFNERLITTTEQEDSAKLYRATKLWSASDAMIAYWLDNAWQA